MATTNGATMDRERELVTWATEIGAQVGDRSTRHDRDGTFLTDVSDVLGASGDLALAVPEAFGGRGATIREVAMAQREPARHCESTALASVMHHHVVRFTAWRHRRELPGVVPDTTRGVGYHPLTPDESLVPTGQVALGLPADER